MTEDAKIEALRLINEIPESGPCNFYADPLMLDWAVKLIALARAPQAGWAQDAKRLLEDMRTDMKNGEVGMHFDGLYGPIIESLLAAAPSPITGEKE